MSKEASEDGKLSPLNEVGGGVAKDPAKEKLSEIIQAMNTLFEGELTDADLLNYANHIRDKMMETLGLIQGNAPHSIATPNALALINLKITPRGYAQLEESRQRNLDSQLGFCAMWFDAELEFLWVDCIEPAIALAGYEPKRIDRHPHNNKIDDEIVAMIRRSKFVVADFTGQRGGVYFEAGFAKGLGLEVIWTVRKDELDEHKVHFDNRQFNFVTWESNRLEDFKNRLQFRIEATLGRGKWMPEVAASGSLV